MENGKKAVDDNKKAVEKAVNKTLSFDNSLVGKMEIDRDTLVKNLSTEHRSYANYSCSIEGQKSFELPELETQYPQGFSLGIVVHLKDNANPENAKKGKLSL
jgi:hypothetical protein